MQRQRGEYIDNPPNSGVEVVVDNTEHHMHHKFALFDRRILLTGSYNWTVSAARRNCENIAVTDDRRLVRAYGEEFERLLRRAVELGVSASTQNQALNALLENQEVALRTLVQGIVGPP